LGSVSSATSKGRASPARSAHQAEDFCGSTSATITREFSAMTLARFMTVVVLPAPPF